LEKLFQLLIDLFDITGGLWLVALVGFVIAACGVFAGGICLVYLVMGKRVSLKVVKLHEKARKIKDSDDEERIAEKKANPVIKAEFEILDGPYKGIRQVSESGSSKPNYGLGDLTKGYYTPKKGGAIIGSLDLRSGFKLSFWLIFFGLGLVAMINFMVGTMHS